MTRRVAMRRLLINCALGAVGLLAARPDTCCAQTQGRPVVVPANGPAVLTLSAGPAQAPAGQAPTITLLAAQPSFTRTAAAETAEPPFAAPKFGDIIPVTYVPAAQPAAANPPVATI